MNDLSEIKLKQNSGIQLFKHFPKITKNQKVLILGNTVGFFGYAPDFSNTNDDLDRFFYFLDLIESKADIIIVGEEEEEKYYAEITDFFRKNKIIRNNKGKFYNFQNSKKYAEGKETNYTKILDLFMKEGKKFDICLMNPPYPDREAGGMYLDMQFTTKCNEISNNVISIQPANRIISNTNLGNKMALNGNLCELDIYNAFDIFGISTSWKYVAIYNYCNNTNFNEIKCINNICKETITYIIPNKQELEKYYISLNISRDIIDLCEKLLPLRKTLFNKYNTMVNDGYGFIYEENRLQRGKNKYNVIKNDQTSLSRVKEYLKTGKYKYCLYKGSFNHDYDEVQEWNGQDPDKLFKGQICWLTNKENVKNNIKYWMECPLFDLWRKYYLYNYKGTPGCSYGLLPALNFDTPENEFKEYVDSLNNFTEDEIESLKKYNVHGADKL